MARRVKGDGYAVMDDVLAIGQRIELDIAQPRLQDTGARKRSKVMGMAGPRMVGVRMRDERTVDRLPGINVKLPRFTKKPFLSCNHQIRHMYA
jgi:hypothetical protein